MQHQDCLTIQLLERRRCGELPEDMTSQVDEHLSSCDRCRSLFGELESDASILSDLAFALDETAADDHAKVTLTDRIQWDTLAEVPGYQIIGEIARGGQGVVYEAIQESTKRQVALKVLSRSKRDTSRPNQQARHNQFSRFEREVDLAAQLDHPNIVTVYDSGETRDGRPYLAMAYIEGQTFDRHIAQHNSSINDIVYDTIALLSGLQHAHQRGVIHRDIKPGNVIVDQSKTPHIVDFGLAKSLNETIETTSEMKTIEGHFLGTLVFASPEQVAGRNSEIDSRTDLYSLGMLLYFVLCGRLPWPTDVPLPMLMNTIQFSRPLPPSEFRADIDHDLELIILKAVATSPEQRYQSAGEFAADLKRWQNNEPVEARPTTTSYRIRKFAQRHKALVTATGLAACLLLASTAIITVLYVRALHAEQRAQDNLADVRGLANTLLFGVHNRIDNLPGSLEAREFIITSALAYLKKMENAAEDDPAFLREIAEGYMQVGDLQGKIFAANLGQSTNAAASYQKAHDMLQPLAAMYPEDIDIQLAYIKSHEKLGDSFFIMQDFDAAIDQYQQAFDRVKALLNEHPTHRNVRRDNIQLSIGLTNIKMKMGLIDEAEDHIQYALEHSQQLVADAPEDAAALQTLAIVRERYARLFLMQRRYDEAAPMLEQSIAHTTQALESDPSNIPNTRSLAIALVQYGDYFRWRDEPDLDSAREQYAKSLELRRQIATDDPLNMQARADVAGGLMRMAEAHRFSGDEAAAMAMHEEAIATYQSLLQDDPLNHLQRRELAVAYEKLANIHGENARFNQARQAAQSSLDLRIELASGRNPSGQALRDLGVAYFKLGNVSMLQAQHETDARLQQRVEWFATGKAHFQQALDVVEGMQDDGMLLDTDAHIPDFLREHIGMCEDGIRQLTVDDEPANLD